MLSNGKNSSLYYERYSTIKLNCNKSMISNVLRKRRTLENQAEKIIFKITHFEVFHTKIIRHVMWTRFADTLSTYVNLKLPIGSTITTICYFL